MATLKKKLTVRLHETDAAGILFFASQFLYVHDAYEELLQLIGLPVASMLRDEPFILPIVHAEAQYFRPLHVGDEITVIVQVGSIGKSSFVLVFDLFAADDKPVGKAKTVHVAVSKQTQNKIALPEKLQRALKAFQSAP
ncbi:MAG: thioesterase family protein [candidate division Zixibacteria bacterium]|jgi:1,4-dihydroxy-2-naphthoyl-CoA hydrolase|nr:thioesterase family protein [candidate division Zixibacteria bacterium]